MFTRPEPSGLEWMMVVDCEIMSQDFTLYVLRERPALPFSDFPEADHRLLRRFVRDKLLLGAVRVFERRLLADDGYQQRMGRYAGAAHAEMNRPRGSFWESFGFLSRQPLPVSMELGSLLGHYALEEFAGKGGEGAVLDVGPYIGDSTFILSRYFKDRRILCFEPDAANRARLADAVLLNGLSQVEVIAKGAGARAAKLPGVQPGSPGAGVQEGLVSEFAIEVDSLDHMLEEARVERVGIMKFDIEGQEKNALFGARATITRDKPLLLVAAYHRGEDIFTLPALLREMVPSYEFHFRHLDPRAHAAEYIIVAFDRGA